MTFLNISITIQPSRTYLLSRQELLDPRQSSLTLWPDTDADDPPLIVSRTWLKLHATILDTSIEGGLTGILV